MSALFAFLHHLAAFTVVATLSIEFVLLRGEITARSARWLQRTDLVYGMAAGALLFAGLLRVFYFEKGAGYYFNSWPFLAKLVLFLVVALASVPPTLEFLSWRRVQRQGQVPALGEERRRRLRLLMHLELTGLVLIIACAVLMARGVGHFG